MEVKEILILILGFALITCPFYLGAKRKQKDRGRST